MSKSIITIRHKGDFSRTTRWLKRSKELTDNLRLERFGEEGVAALSSATPIDTGKTASSWYYEIEKSRDGISIHFKNSNIQNVVPIAIILQYGHGTRNGGWVQGRDYINPSIQPIMDELTKEAWKEVTKG